MKNGNPQRLVIKPHVETHGRACNQIKCIMHNCGEIQTSSTIHHPSSIIHHQSSIVNHQPSTINRIVEVRIEQSWKEVLAEEFEKPYFSLLASFIRKEYQETEVYPPGGKIFSAFDLTPFRDVKVVILGQDPYHEPGQAHGLAFSVQPGVQIPPSLQNIYKEIADDVHSPYPNSGFLERWAKQGVLLLNNVLTVRRAAPLSHQGKGWEEFTDRVVELLSSKRENLVFMLWGSQAQRKGLVIDTKKHLVLKAPHPSPLSAYRGFFGCKHFSKANEYLIQHGKNPIVW